jgi:hypothetical protein
MDVQDENQQALLVTPSVTSNVTSNADSRSRAAKHREKMEAAGLKQVNFLLPINLHYRVREIVRKITAGEPLPAQTIEKIVEVRVPGPERLVEVEKIVEVEVEKIISVPAKWTKEEISAVACGRRVLRSQGWRWQVIKYLLPPPPAKRS